MFDVIEIRSRHLCWRENHIGILSDDECQMWWMLKLLFPRVGIVRTHTRHSEQLQLSFAIRLNADYIWKSTLTAQEFPTWRRRRCGVIRERKENHFPCRWATTFKKENPSSSSLLLTRLWCCTQLENCTVLQRARWNVWRDETMIFSPQ